MLLEALREEKASKGESHERCRCEKKPTRDQLGVKRQEGNQTLKAERSGQAKPMSSGPLILICAEGTEKPMRGVDRLRLVG
jgi:hypothetical protein